MEIGRKDMGASERSLRARFSLAQLLSASLGLVLLVANSHALAQVRNVDVARFIPNASMSMHDLYFETMRYSLYERPSIGDAPMKGPAFDAFQRQQEKTTYPCLKERLFDKDPEYWSRFYRGGLALYRFQYATQRKPTDSELARLNRTIHNFDYFDLEQRQLQLAKTIESAKLQLKIGMQCD